MTAAQSKRDFFIKNERRQTALSEILEHRRIIQIFKYFRRAEIEPILIKGWSIGRFYPPNERRQTADIDLTFAPEDFEKAEKIAEKLDLPPEILDLHCGLRYLDKLSFADLFARSQLVQLHEAEIRVLCHEDNLRLACFHWLNDGGERRERLKDIYYLVENRPADFDWHRFLDSNGARRRKWLVCALAIAARELNLDLSGTPVAEEIKKTNVLPRWLLRSLEKEWQSEIKIGRISDYVKRGDYRMVFKQILKRLPPNALRSSVLRDAPFDDTPRLPYQIADAFSRLLRAASRAFSKIR
jgi:hypothetical protein